MSIYLKLAAVVAVCFGVGIWALSFVAIDTVNSETFSHIEKENEKATELLSQDLGRELKMFISKMNAMTQVVQESQKGTMLNKVSAILNSEDDFVSFGVYSLNQDKYGEVLFLAKPESLAEFGFQLSDLKNFSPDTLALDVKQSAKGFRFGPLAPAFKSTLINLSYFTRSGNATWLVRSEVRQDHWTRFLNHYPDMMSSILDSKNKIIMSSNPEFNSKTFDDDSNLVTSFSDLKLGDLKVAVSSPKQAFMGFEKSLRYRLMLVGVMILGLSLIVINFFTSHIVTPLKNLLQVLERVVSGHNDVNLSVSRGDEIGTLAIGLSQLINLFKSNINKSQVLEPVHMMNPATASMATHRTAAAQTSDDTLVGLLTEEHHQERQPFSEKSKPKEVEIAPVQEIKPHANPNPFTNKEGWFLVRNSQSSVDEGPFTLDQLKAFTNEPNFIVAQAYVYRPGDSYMMPFIQVAGLSRRSQVRPPVATAFVPPPEIQAKVEALAHTDEWFIYGGEDKTLGPYSAQLLKEALDSGQIQRTTYCWRQGMTQWIFVYEIPDFDRRNSGPPAPPIPLGKVA
jgi:hypothetical protein